MTDRALQRAAAWPGGNAPPAPNCPPSTTFRPWHTRLQRTAYSDNACNNIPLHLDNPAFLMSGTQRLCLVTAVYNDWLALFQLLTDVESRFASQGISFDVLVVNDGSTAQLQPDLENYRTGGVICSIGVLDLRANVGNQFALATGLRYAAQHFDQDAVLVMDADGEDTVEDALRLVEAWRAKPNVIIVGQLTKR